MTCRLYEQHLSSYLDGELSARRQVWLEAHLQTCPRCREDLRGLRRIPDHLRAVTHQLQISPDFDQRVLTAAGQIQVTRPRVRRRFSARPVVIAMIAVLSLLSVVREFLAPPSIQPVPAGQAAVSAATPGSVDRDDR